MSDAERTPTDQDVTVSPPGTTESDAREFAFRVAIAKAGCFVGVLVAMLLLIFVIKFIMELRELGQD